MKDIKMVTKAKFIKTCLFFPRQQTTVTTAVNVLNENDANVNMFNILWHFVSV